MFSMVLHWALTCLIYIGILRIVIYENNWTHLLLNQWTGPVSTAVLALCGGFWTIGWLRAGISTHFHGNDQLRILPFLLVLPHKLALESIWSGFFYHNWTAIGRQESRWINHAVHPIAFAPFSIGADGTRNTRKEVILWTMEGAAGNPFLHPILQWLRNKACLMLIPILLPVPFIFFSFIYMNLMHWDLEEGWQFIRTTFCNSWIVFLYRFNCLLVLLMIGSGIYSLSKVVRRCLCCCLCE